ncbi:substrate-binding periplasmic protein [Niveispirillum lacus]|uniref:substrate-binding periplasmic protein n=1 Tax=Niveispirillum lacus TaxID=1981099 RepID=UPI0013FE1A62|nr:transporter substrate-binding domain-containing protein [Niveispirillum lacus]
MQARPLTFAYGDHNEAPFAIVKDGELKGGFALEFGRSLADRLGMEAAFRFVPRNRISAEIAGGSVDAYCLAAQPYYPGFSADHFTTPLFTDQDVILLSAGLRGPADLSSLTGARIGAVLGFIYPASVEALFADHQAERIDARNAEANLRKLHSGRLDAVILPMAAWRLALSRDQSLAGLVRKDVIPVAVRDRVCLVSPSSPASVPEINAAIQSLVADGSLPALVRASGLEMSGAQSAGLHMSSPIPSRR